ncbi:MAG: acyltransferase [Bacteroidales bacterium]|nr:acyltransferase [Bacteroidales bacterium]
MKSIDYKKYTKQIFEIKNDSDFNRVALQAFQYQYENNNIYKSYCDLLKVDIATIDHPSRIPFLPIEFFKTHQVVSGARDPQIVFESSGTTGTTNSKHFVADIELYEKSFISTFKKHYGDPKEIVILGLLPSYLERNGSSLVYMVSKLCELSENKMSGFYLSNYKELYDNILMLENAKQKYLIIGVSYALLDLAEQFAPKIENGIILETGGMKGRRKEITKEALHNTLSKSFSTNSIHSEYGMTELLSQAYSQKHGVFTAPSQMRVYIREYNDPLSTSESGTGAINIIDLANINSCCFIATSDLGVVSQDKSFTITGRLDSADIRGCNLMVI